MSNVEHMFENAVDALMEKKHKVEWVNEEYHRGNMFGHDERDLDVIWECASFLCYAMFPNTECLKEALEAYV